MIPVKTYHRSISGDDGSVVINQSSRTEGFDHNTEFVPVSAAENKRLYEILKHEKPVIHTLGE